MRIRQGIIITATVVSIGVLAPGTASADTAPPVQYSSATAAADSPIGWDEDGPYFLWGNMRCRVHLFKPREWLDMWGTGRCWF